MSTDLLSAEDLAELELLREEATPGPFKVEYSEGYDHLNGHQRVYGYSPVEGGFDDDEADSKYVVALLNAAPRLLAMIKDQGEAYGILRDRLGETRVRAMQAEGEVERLRGVVDTFKAAVGDRDDTIREQRAALDRVEKLADDWRYKGEFGWGPWQAGEGPSPDGQILDDAAREIQRALAGDDSGGAR